MSGVFAEAGMTPLAHAGGWDEMLALAVPVVIIWAWRTGRRERASTDDASKDSLRQTGTDPPAEGADRD